MEAILKKEFHDLAMEIHEKEHLSQMQLSAALLMDRRSPVAIESGEHKCGELTIILMLLYLPDGNPFLQSLKKQLEIIYNTEELLV